MCCVDVYLLREVYVLRTPVGRKDAGNKKLVGKLNPIIIIMEIYEMQHPTYPSNNLINNIQI